MKRSIGIFSFLLTILIVGWSIIPSNADVALLPNGVQQFFDNSGKPLTSGSVTTYTAGTSTLKSTWSNSTGTITNTNPIRLDGGGKAIIYGTGDYRQVVKDRNGNLIWDAVTAPGGGGSTPTLVGDGNLVGTILPWSGLVAPNQYVFGYGQEIVRATYSDFYTAITQQSNVICSAASNILTGLTDTTQIKIGSAVELALCVVAGTTVTAKTAATVTLSNPSSVSINAVATFFPWGNGNGSTTFNVPDFRGSTLSGRDNMGGTAASRLVNGANTGQRLAISTTALTYTSQAPTKTVLITGTALTYTTPANVTALKIEMVAGGGGGAAQATNNGANGTNSTWAGSGLSTWTVVNGNGATTAGVAGIGGTGGTDGTGTKIRRIDGEAGQTLPTNLQPGSGGGTTIMQGAYAPNTAGAGVAAVANTGAGGSGGGAGSGAANGPGGGGGEYVEFTLTGTQVISQYTYTVGAKGAGGAAGTRAGGDGAAGVIIVTEYYSTTTTPSLTSTTAGTVQFTDTINYVVKITPDTSTSIATGVYSIGGMTGVITCSTGLLCTGNTISVTSTVNPGGSDTYVQFNNSGVFGGSANFKFISPDTVAIGAVGTTGKFDIYGTTSGNVRQTAQAIAGTPTITWGTSSGTPAATASLPLAIATTTGNVTCISCATIPAGGALSATSPITLTAGVVAISGSALTKTDDTNVTLTLGGNSTTALISAASLTLGWTGQLSVARGGTGIASGTSGGIPYYSGTTTIASTAVLTQNQLVLGGGAGAAPATLGSLGTTTTVLHGNAAGAPTFGAVSLTTDVSGQLPLANGGTSANLTASNGGIFYSTAAAGAILSGTATASLPLLSGSSTTPTWAIVSHPVSAVSGGIAYFSSTSVMTSSALLAANQIMVGGGAGTAPTTFACATTTTVVHGGTPPTCSQIVAGDITTNTVTNSNLSQVAAYTFKGNSTGSLANVQDFTIPGLTNKAAPTGSDLLIIADAAASNATKYCTITQCLGAVTSGVSALNTLTGGLTIVAGTGISTISASGTQIAISADTATATNFFAGTANKMLDASVPFSTESTTTFLTTTTALDFNTFVNTKITLTANTGLSCSNMKASQSGTITFIQDSTGTRVITPATASGWCSQFRFASNTIPTLTTSASAVDVLSYSCRTTTYCIVALIKGMNP